MDIEDDVAEAVDAGRDQRRIKSIEVGFRIIRVLEMADGNLPLVRIAALSAMPSSKAYIYLASFMREGLVAQDPVTGYYGLGPFSVQLGLAAIKNLDVVNVGRDVVDTLRDTTGCGISLVLWGDRGPSLVLKADGEGQGSLGMRVGHVFWPSSSAPGRLFLAHLPERDTAEAMRIERLAGEGVPETELEADLVTIRIRGYAVSHRPTVTGRTAVAAPVFDIGGKPAAALVVLATHTYKKDGVLDALLSSADEISRRLGARIRARQDATALTTSSKRPSSSRRK